MKKVILLLVVLVGTVALLCSCECKHEKLLEATCTTPATCSNCGETFADALGHTNGEWIVEKEATCTEKGSKYQVCSVCEETIRTKALQKLGHTDGAWIIDKEATCTDTGSAHQICSVCEATLKTVTLPRLGHTDGAWITDIEPNCTEDGSKHQVCSVCDATLRTETITKLGHTGGAWIIDKEPNCTEDGSKHQVCSVCEVSFKEETIPAIGHSFGEWNITQVATCAMDGQKERICFCNFKETISYSVQHNPEYVSTSQNGNDFLATWYCSICDVQYQKSFDPLQATISMWRLTSGYRGWDFSWKVDSYGGIGTHRYTFLVTSLYSGQVLYMSNWQSDNMLTWQSPFNDSWTLSTPIRVFVYISDSVGGSTAYTFDMYDVWGVSNQRFYYTYTP